MFGWLFGTQKTEVTENKSGGHVSKNKTNDSAARNHMGAGAEPHSQECADVEKAAKNIQPKIVSLAGELGSKNRATPEELLGYMDRLDSLDTQASTLPTAQAYLIHCGEGRENDPEFRNTHAKLTNLENSSFPNAFSHFNRLATPHLNPGTRGELAAAGAAAGGWGAGNGGGLRPVGRRIAAGARKTWRNVRNQLRDKASSGKPTKPEKGDKVQQGGQSKTKPKTCACITNPVKMPSGYSVAWDAFFILPGLMPLRIQSAYHAEWGIKSCLGNNRLSDLDATLEQTIEGQIKYLDSDREPVHFKRPFPLPDTWEIGDTPRGLKISADHDRRYIVKDGGLFTLFDKSLDGKWRISGYRDRNQNELLIERNAAFLVQKIINPEGLQAHFKYNSNGLRESVDLEGLDGKRIRILDYRYDDRGNLIHSESPFGDKLEYRYDDKNRLVGYRRNEEYVAEYAHDDKGRRVNSRTSGPYNGDRLEYDDRNRIATYRSSAHPNHFEKYYYSEDEVTFNVADSDYGFTRTIFDENGFEIENVDPEGNRIEFTYDHEGNIASVTDGEGRTNHFYWGDDNNLEIEIDPAGHATDYHYDPNGNIELIENEVGSRFRYQNNEFGQVTSVRRHDGALRAFEYDENHFQVSETAYNGASTTFEHDSFSRVVSVRDDIGRTTRFEYMPQTGWDFWSPTKIIKPDGTELSYSVGDNRNQITISEAGERETTINTDAFGDIKSTIDPLGNSLEFHQDNAKRLVEVVNQAGKSWTFERDAAGRVIRESDFSGQVFVYRYDRASRLIETTRNDGGRTEYEYDKSNLILREAVFEPNGKEPSETLYEYDDCARVCTITNENAKLEFEYDAAGRLIAEMCNGTRIESGLTRCGNRASRRILAPSDTINKGVELNGLSEGERNLALLAQRDEAAEPGPELHFVSYLNDALGDLAQIKIGNRSPLDFTRDALGREIKRSNSEGFELNKHYDEVGRLARQDVVKRSRPTLGFFGKGTAQEQLLRDYAWNKFDEPIAIADAQWGTKRYEYDSRGQITKAGFEDGSTERYRYDNALNIESFDERAPITTSGTEMRDGPIGTAVTTMRLGSGASDVSGSDRFSAWQTSTGGRVQQSVSPRGTTVHLKHDGRGRVIERLVERKGFRTRKWRFAWNGRDQLVEALTPDGDRWRYTYDPLGRRLSKQRFVLVANDELVDHDVLIERDNHRRVWQRASLSEFLWDGNVLAWEETNGKRIYWHFEKDSFAPLAREEEGGALSYVICDHLGTPRELLSESGELVWSAEYTLWGAVRRLWQADNDNSSPPDRGSFQGFGYDGKAVYSTRWFGSDGNAALKASNEPDPNFCPIRFQGQWADEETGLYYNRHRTYDPETTQYLSPDPIGLLGGVRQHAYVSSPMAWIDPFGLANGKCCCDPDAKEAFRAVSEAEYQDIQKNGFRMHPEGRSMEDKWFSESKAGAEKFVGPLGADRVVRVKMPKAIYDEAFKHPNIDGNGPGFVVQEKDLSKIDKC